MPHTNITLPAWLFIRVCYHSTPHWWLYFHISDYELVDHMGSKSQNGDHHIKILDTGVPRVEPSVDTKRGQWMLSHVHVHVQIWLLQPLSLNLIFKSKSKSNLSQSCSCLCPEDKSFPVIHAMGEKLTWDDYLTKIIFCIFIIKFFVWPFLTPIFATKALLVYQQKLMWWPLLANLHNLCHLHFCLQAGSWAARANPGVGGEIR